MNKSIRIACLQYHAIPKEYNKNKETIQHLLDDAAKEKPDIILMPELSFNGHYYSNDKNSLCESIFDETFQFLKLYSEKLNALIVAGINEKIDESDFCYSTTLLVDNGEFVGSYRKLHPPSVELVFVKPGEANKNIFQTRFGSIMVLTCYDTSFPDSYQSAFTEKVDLILISNAWLKMEKMPFIHIDKYEHHTVLPRAIAMQTRCPVAVANMVGPTKIIVPSLPMFGNRIIDFKTEFCGNSFICDHMGTVLSMMDDSSMGCICTNVNIKLANEIKRITVENYGVDLMKNYIGKRSTPIKNNDLKDVMHMIKVSGINHFYGKKQVLFDINISINKGEMVGILGKNGAGKSTLIDIITGLKMPSSGLVEYGFPKEELYKRFGIQLQEAQFDARLSIKDWCDFWLAMNNIPRQRLDELLELLDLKNIINQKISKLSGGQKQKLNILFAILHDPEMLIFDELTTGLDSPSRKDIRKKLKKLCENGKTLILVSHYMEELEELCSRFIIINDGRIVEDSDLQSLKTKYQASNLEECFEKVLDDKFGMNENNDEMIYMEENNDESIYVEENNNEKIYTE